jgi:hypothetical protein
MIVRSHIILADTGCVVNHSGTESYKGLMVLYGPHPTLSAWALGRSHLGWSVVVDLYKQNNNTHFVKPWTANLKNFRVGAALARLELTVGV